MLDMKDFTEYGNIRNAWIDFVRRFACNPPTIIIQERKFQGGVLWDVLGGDWAGGIDITPQHLGYRPNSSKLSQLTKNYFNKEGFEKAREKLVKRIREGKAQTSVAAPTIAGEKREESMGHCIQSVAITYYRYRDRGEYLEVDFFYRTTEIIQKFLADLHFLRYKVIPFLTDGIENIPITRVGFRFASAFMSPLFLPVYFNWVDPVEFMKELKEKDPEFYQKCLFRVHAPLTRERGYYSFRTRRQMHELYFQLIEKGIIDKVKLLDFIEREIAGAKAKGISRKGRNR